MFDFRPRVPTRNYLSRREQRRVFAWVMGIGLVLMGCLSIDKIRQFAQARSVAAAQAIDTRFRPDTAASGDGDSVAILRPSEEDESVHAHPGSADVNPEWLSSVRDDTPWIRHQEIDAWINLWTVLARTGDQEITRQSTGPVGFVELFGQPEAFRGKLVTVRGSARQAVYLKAAENSAAVRGYYRVIIMPEGGPAEPLFLYTLELPPGFPIGEEIRAEISATGFFFKRMVYPTKDTSELRRAPVVMSRSLVRREPTPALDGRQSALVATMIGGTVLGVVGLIGVGVWAARTGNWARPQLPASVATVDDRGIVDVHESLARLAENEQ